MEVTQVFEEREPRELQVVDHASIAAAEAAKARVQAAYIMAYKNPRNIDQSRVRILEACRRPAFAERVKYSKPVGKSKISGPSIRFAETALRDWGNILVDTQVLYEDENIKRTKVMCVDLETNTQFSKDISIEKTVERKGAADRDIIRSRKNSYNETVYIVRATEDEVHNKESALISKAIRNEGLRLLPSDIVDEAMEIADETLRNRDAQDPSAAKKKVMDSFAEIGVYPKDIEKYLGHPLANIAPHELNDLRGVFRAIRDGETTWQIYVDDKKETAGAVPPKAAEMKSKLSAERESNNQTATPEPEQQNTGGDSGSSSRLSMVQVNDIQKWMSNKGLDLTKLSGLIGRKDILKSINDLSAEDVERLNVIRAESERAKKGGTK